METNSITHIFTPLVGLNNFINSGISGIPRTISLGENYFLYLKISNTLDIYTLYTSVFLDQGLSVDVQSPRPVEALYQRAKIYEEYLF